MLAATGVTQVEFPLGFVHVVTSDATGVTLMFLRNGLLVAATLIAGGRLWRDTVTRWPPRSAEPVPNVLPPARREVLRSRAEHLVQGLLHRSVPP